MEKQREQLFCLALVCALALGATSASAQNPFGILHSFTNAPNDGANPEGQPILIASNLFGVTFYGGDNSLGAIYQVCTNGTNYNVIYSFDGDVDGANPFCTLAASGPFFYGMTFNGGVADGGVLFRVRTNGTYSVLHTFMGGNTDGLYPFGSVIVTNGTLFGMTSSGGTNDDGVVFKMGTNTTGFAVLHSFAGGTLDGSSPSEGVTLGGTNLFGTTFSGGSNNLGTVFSMVTNGASYRILHHFTGPNTNSDGANPSGPLTLNGSTLYGITTAGGPTNAGTVFKLNTDGSGYAVLHSFSTNTTDGAYPQFGPLLVTNSLIYGVTENGGSNTAGVVFQITTSGTGFTILHSFVGSINDGAFPDWPPILNGSSFYGLTIDGGISNAGVIYGPTASVTTPPPTCTNTVTVLANSSTGVAYGNVVAGQWYAYTASGCASSGGADSNPDGVEWANGSGCSGPIIGSNQMAGISFTCPGLKSISLVGRVGSSCIQLGSSGVFAAPESGTLTLYYNDSQRFDNSGSFQACIMPVSEICTTMPGNAAVVIANVVAGQTYSYSASGCVSWGAFNQYATPDGTIWSNNCTTFVSPPFPSAGYFPPFPCPNTYWTSLVGTINDGDCIQMGNSGTFTANATGPLTLFCNDNHPSDNGGSWYICLTPFGDFRITSIVTITNDVFLTWNTPGGRTNAVQVTPGDAQGNFNTNGFVDLSGYIIVPGVGSIVTNYYDVGGATNYPCRYYRIRLVP